METPDPRRSLYLFACGRKGEGKSVWCRAWFDQYPFDRIVIDPTGDVRADLTKDGVDFVAIDQHVIPTSFPRSAEGHQVTLVYCPDMGDPDAADQMDRVVGLCLDSADHPVMLWVDEVGRLTTAHSTPPNTRRALHHGRHHALTLLGAAPRPMDIDPLFINQADLVAAFRLPNPTDRRRVADNIGFAPAEFDELNAGLATHEYLLYVQAEDLLYVCPPLPRPGRTVEPYAPLPA